MIHLHGIGQQVGRQHRLPQSTCHFVQIIAVNLHAVMKNRLQIDRHGMFPVGDQIFVVEITAVKRMDDAKKMSCPPIITTDILSAGA